MDRLSAFRKECGDKIPESFNAWLESINGTSGMVGELTVPRFGLVGVRSIFGIHSGPESEQVDLMYQLLRDNLGQGRLAFADDEGGNLFVLRLGKGDVVYFWDHETDEEYFIADDFDGFIDGLTKIQLNLEIPEELLEDILKRDDVDGLRKFMGSVDEKWRIHDRTILEEGAVQAAKKCVMYLHGQGVPLGNALEIAKRNARFFPEHVPLVEWMEGLSQ